MKNALIEAVELIEKSIRELDPASDTFDSLAMAGALISESCLAVDPTDGLCRIERLEAQAQCAHESYEMLGGVVETLTATRKHLRGGNITTG